MRREELLAKGYTEGQVSELLDMFHKNSSNVSKENQDLKSQIDSLNNKIAGLTKVESEYNALKQSQLSEQEKQEIAKQETAKNLAESRKILNTAKVKEIFSEVGGLDEKVLNAIITDDEATSIANATALLNTIKNRDVVTTNKVKEEMSAIDIKPTPSNVLGGEDVVNSWEKFDKLSSDEQVKFAEEHPDEFNNLK